MRKKALSILLCISMVFPAFFAASIPVSAATWTIGSNDPSWKAVYPANNQNDYLQDQQTGSGSVSQDIVGDASYPSTYMHLTDTEAAFRIRVSNVNGTNPYEFKNFAFVGMDADLNGSVDLFLGVYNPTGNNGRLGIYGSSSGYLNTGPSTTGISGKPLLAFKPVKDSNYSITATGDGSTFNNDADYFVSFKFALSDIKAALAQKGISNFDASTPFRFMTGTAAQDNAFNQDLNGMDKSGWSSTKTWTQLGTFSDAVTANGNVAYYTVKFDSNTGETAASPDFKVVEAGGKTLGALPGTEPKKKAMYFQEWNELPDGTGKTITSSTIVDKNMTVYAIWSDKQSYKVTFDLGGGTIGGQPDSVVVSTRDGVVGDRMPVTPTKGTSIFEGWNTAASGNTGTWFNGATPVTADKTIYARWTNVANKTALYYNNFTSSGGSLIATIYSNGQSSQFNGSAPTVTRPGYTFVNWYSNKEGTGTAASQVSEGTFYAKWTPITSTITFVANAGSDTVTGMPASKTVNDGKFGTIPAAPVRAGYQFIEWNKTADGLGEAIYPSTLITGNTSVYAIWKASKNVIFDPNGGTGGTQTITAVGGKLNTLPQPPSRDNYSFEGWGTSTNATSSVDLRDVTSYSTLYAIWSPVYTVTFNANGGQLAGGAATTDILTAYGNVLYLPDNPDRTKFTFGGWNTKADGTGSAFTSSTAVTQPATQVYAVWTPVPGSKYTVVFEANGGSSVASVETASIETSPVSTKSGYTLEGWYRDPALTEASKVSFPYSVTSDMTLYAKWTPNSSTVALNANGGNGGSTSVTATLDQAMPAASAPTREGYQFGGYFDDPTNGVQYYDASMTSAKNWDKTDNNVTLYAHWTAVELTVTFNANNGKYTNDLNETQEKQIYDLKYVLPAEKPKLPGSDFASWNTQADGTGTTVTTNTTVRQSADHTLYAIWTEAGKVTLTYAVEDEKYGTVSSGSESLNPVTGEAVGSTAVPKSGYSFVEWKDADGNQVSQNAAWVPQKVDGSYTSGSYTAIFQAITSQVTLDSQGGSGGSEQVTATYDQAMPKAEPPSQPGYTFAGYYDEQTGGNPYYDANMNSARNWDKTGAAVTLYAHWTELEKVTIRYTANNDQYGKVSRTEELLNPVIGEAIGATAEAKPNYAFVEWQDAEGTRVSTKEEFIPSKSSEGYNDATYTAVFKAVNSSVTLNANGGTGGTHTVTAFYNQPMPEASAPSYAGHTFLGYYDEQTGGTPYYDANMESVRDWDKTESQVTLYAHWTEVGKVTLSYTVNDERFGTVSPSEESLNPVTGEAEGSTAQAKTGYRFVKWQDSEGTQVSTEKTLIPQKSNGKYVSETYTAVFEVTTSSVTGTVIDDAEQPKPVTAATIRIVKGNTQFGDTTLTDSNGKFTIYNIPAGTYNLIMKIGDKTEIIAITVKENEPVTELGKVIFPLGNASSLLNLKTPETPPVVIDKLHPEAEAYLKEEMDKGFTGFVKVEMSVAKVDDKATEPEVKKGVENIFAEAQKKSAYIGIYLDITLDKYKRTAESDPWGPSQGKLKETNGLIKIIVPIPADLQGKTSNLYRVYRDHENEPTHTIQAKPNADGEYLELNAEGQTLTLYVKKFSVYALAYLTPAAYSVEHYAMNADGSYPAAPTKITSGSGISDTELKVSDLTDPALSASGFTYGYGTVDGANATTALVKGDGTLVLKLYYARQPQAPAAPPSSPAPSAPSPSVTYYDVTFDSTGGKPASFKQSAAAGTLLTPPAQPVRAGYVFGGWNKADGSAWNFSTDRVNGPVTLSAKWSPEIVPPALDKVNHFAYMQGYPDRTFRADRNMTRAEVIAMFSRLLTEKMDMEQRYPSTFRDVKGSNWYADAVGYMQQHGIVTGYANGTFGPEEPITRAEFAAIASRFDQLEAGAASTFTDVRASYWAGESIASGAAKGWIKGYPDGTFRPEEYVTRAEAVTLVNRMTERHADRSHIDQNGSQLKQYSDLKKTYWAYYDIMEAVNRHDYVKSSQEETWTNPTEK